MRIALELHLKRLIVGGFEKVYEVGRVFRNEGLSPRHNPEFTMLESYEAYADYEDVMRFLEELIPATIESAGKAPELEYQGERLDFAPPYRRARMADLVKETTGIDVLTEPDLAGAAAKVGVEVQPNLPWGFVVMEIYEKKVETGLRQPTFVVDYPLDVSPLARKRADDPRFVERFELVAAGRELCNAFTELTDPVDQRERFLAQEAAFQAFGGETHPMDEDYLMALELGMPPTGGLGIGIDRLVSAPAAAPVPAGYLVTGELDVDGDRLTEYLNLAGAAYFAPGASADLVLAERAVAVAISRARPACLIITAINVRSTRCRCATKAASIRSRASRVEPPSANASADTRSTVLTTHSFSMPPSPRHPR